MSPPHAPPERFLGTPGASQVAADVYSLGSTLHQALTGRPPFGTVEEGSIALLMNRIIGDPVPPIGRADVPTSLEAVLRTAMAKDPADRYASMDEFAAALRHVDLSGPSADRSSDEWRPPPTGGQAATVVTGPGAPSTAGVPPHPGAPPPAGATVAHVVLDADARPAAEERPRHNRRLLAGGLATVAAVAVGTVVAITGSGGDAAPPTTTVLEAEPPVFLSKGVGMRPEGVVVISGENPNESPELARSVVFWELRKKGDTARLRGDVLAQAENSDGTQFASPFGPVGPVDYFVPDLDPSITYCVVLRLRASLDATGAVLASSEERCTDGTMTDPPAPGG